MARIPLYYTFGNHMHWVDMEWLWGYHVLPGSIRDMLHFCRETGAKGNVNFEGIGYEKLAAEDPEALAELREAVQSGTIEPVGCSYGQPYGLFHGGESNLRQRVYGARTVRRLLGVWPKTFWEEEFDFFPQLPQMLKGCGFQYASLFFQWTWHTPEIPKEDAPVILWEGQDGSQLVCATRNKLNLHQWPEDMDATFAELALDPPVPGEGPTPLILQWLELMPSPDWMCRSEVLLPKMRELLADDRFEIRMATLGEYLGRGMGVPPMVSSDVPSESAELTIRQADEHDQDGHATHRLEANATIPTRQYNMDQVWHGMSLGKNGDGIRKISRSSEEMLVSYEALFSTISMQGRPYAQWDAYPTWELEECWRKLLSAQHHDNDECEGLCAHVAYADYAWIDSLKTTFRQRIQRHGKHWSQGEGLFNPNGWEAFGIAPFSFGEEVLSEGRPNWSLSGHIATVCFQDLTVEVDTTSGDLLSFQSKDYPDGVFTQPVSLLPVAGDHIKVGRPKCKLNGYSLSVEAKVNNQSYVCYLRVNTDHGGLEIFTNYDHDHPLSGGFQGALKLDLPFRSLGETIRTDTPYGVVTVHGLSEGHKKYPTGDWMTSTQWFEEIRGAFYGQSFVSFDEPHRGIMVAQETPKQWFRSEGGAQCILGSYDPWDEDNFGGITCFLTLVPYSAKSNAECWKLANEKSPLSLERRPEVASPLTCDKSNVVVTAFFRETEDYSGRHVENYAGTGMGYPFVIRLVEFDGLATEAKLTVAGTVAKAYKTNHLGQIEQDITDGLVVKLRPYEIATVYLDIVEARKQTRDLDAKREIWATVHRVD